MVKSQFLEPKQRHSPKSEGSLWQNDDYCSEYYFPSAYQISCNSNFVAQMIFTSAFLPCTILGMLGSPERTNHIFYSSTFLFPNLTQIRENKIFFYSLTFSSPNQTNLKRHEEERESWCKLTQLMGELDYCRETS